MYFKEINTRIGLEGLPQSATCQTALFTGYKLYNTMECHIPGLPNKRLISIIYRTNLLQRLENRGLEIDFINAYHENYFKRRFNNLSLTTHLVLNLSKSHFYFLEDIKSGNAIFADITNEHLRKEGYNIDLSAKAQCKMQNEN
ncbi:MAG: hypothetical protein H0Z29_06740 [Candidatus Marinimicrobia bacterium]|nr:hypothetical protein [Candidatus Neomarinimicrobiota bacterium]